MREVTRTVKTKCLLYFGRSVWCEARGTARSFAFAISYVKGSSEGIICVLDWRKHDSGRQAHLFRRYKPLVLYELTYHHWNHLLFDNSFFFEIQDTWIYMQICLIYLEQLAQKRKSLNGLLSNTLNTIKLHHNGIFLIGTPFIFIIVIWFHNSVVCCVRALLNFF